MKNRIKTLINKENVNATKFAEYIGISPSSLHHIVSGRNNPSLEVIQKILNRFEYVNAFWLITGKGEPFNKMEQASLFKSDEIATITRPTEKSEKTENDKKKEIENVSENKSIEKIVIFYKDKTFESFKPSI